MAKTTQLTIPVANRPGTLAHVASVLGESKVNMLAFVTTTSNAEGAVHVVVDNLKKAKTALESAGLCYQETSVLYVELPNKPGALASFTGKLAAKDINITLGYQTSAKGTRKAGVVLGVSDLDKALRVRG